MAPLPRAHVRFWHDVKSLQFSLQVNRNTLLKTASVDSLCHAAKKQRTYLTADQSKLDSRERILNKIKIATKLDFHALAKISVRTVDKM